jgi:hypothetical protein
MAEPMCAKAKIASANGTASWDHWNEVRVKLKDRRRDA